MSRKHPLAKCEECPLQEIGRYVPSDGPDKAAVAFVGEAPGANEARGGKPFAGMSGKLLDEVLRHHGIRRDRALLTNACNCRPPDNAAPPKAAIAACRPRLLAELQEREVETVVALGNSAAQSLLATSEGVSKLRAGLGHKSPHLDDVRVITTYHPAACFRSGDFFPFLVADIGKLKIKATEWTPPDYKVFDDPFDACAVLDTLYAYPTDRIVIDIETDIDKDEAYDHPNNFELLCIGICYAKGKVVVIERNALKHDRVLEKLGRLLRAKKLIAQNGKYDASGLYPVIGDIEIWFDTMIASYCLDERPRIHSLDFQGVEVLGTPNWKHDLDPWEPKKNGYGVIPPHILDKYNAYDCAVTWDLAELWMEQLEANNLRPLHDFLCAAANQLKFVELNGITIDWQYNTEMMTSYLDSIAKIDEEIIDIIDRPEWSNFNPRSPKQVKEVLEGVFGTRVASTDEETLTNLGERAGVQGHEQLMSFCAAMLRHRREAKLYGTYVKGIRKRTYRGRVFPNFLVHGTTTGRLACRNPNLQNIPRESAIRKQFVPSKPENVFVSVDYSQAELRVLAWLAQDEYLRAIFNDPTRDLFNELRPVLYGNTDGMSPAQLKELRIRIKAYVYGLSYGREEYSIASEFKIPVAEARRGMEAFFEVIPSVVAFREQVKNKILSQEDLVNPFGRRRRFWLITDHNKESSIKEGLAFLPQSTASDICLGAFTSARPALKGKAFIRNLVHDSIMAECHEDNAEEVGNILEEHMLASARNVVGDWVRFATDVTIGKNWGEL